MPSSISRASAPRACAFATIAAAASVGVEALGRGTARAPARAAPRAAPATQGRAARSSRSSRPAATRASAARSSSASCGGARVDELAHRALGEPPERHELAPRADRLGDRPEVVGDQDDHRVRRRLLEILEQRVGRVLVQQVRALDRDRRAGRPRTGACAGRAAARGSRRCGSSRRARRARRDRRGTRARVPSSARANVRATSRLPTPGGPWKRYACAGPFAQRGVEEAPGLLVLREARERAHGSPLRSPRRAARRRARRCAPGSASASSRYAASTRCMNSSSSRSIRSRSRRARRARLLGVDEHAGTSAREAARAVTVRFSSRTALLTEATRDPLVGDGRIEVAVAHDVVRRARAPAGSRSRRARRAPPRTAPPRPTARPRRRAARASEPPRRPASRPARASQARSAPARAASSASSSACVLFPEPSIPSKVTNMPRLMYGLHAGGRHRGCGVHRLEPRRRARRPRRRRDGGRQLRHRQAREPEPGRAPGRARHPGAVRRSRPTSSSTSRRRPTCRPR